jgi:hypothetical protein
MNPRDVLEVKEIHSSGERLFKVAREGREYYLLSGGSLGTVQMSNNTGVVD